MYRMEPTRICPKDFHAAVKKLRAFFEGKGWVEVHTQSRLSILAACEDPTTISTYSYAGEVWPLPQTGQKTSPIVMISPGLVKQALQKIIFSLQQ